MTRGIRAAAVISWLATGCVTTPTEDVASTSQAVAPANAGLVEPGCAITPSCSLTPVPGYTDPLQIRLRCGAATEYLNDPNAAFLGGIGSLCPDTPTNRKALHAVGKRAFLPGYCSSCLSVPPGSLYVFWSEREGPQCPSSCAPGNEPSPL